MNNVIARINYVLLPLLLVSGMCYGHEGDIDETHGYDDAYLAEQARLKEGEIPYLIDHWQQDFSGKLKNLRSSMLPDLIKSASAGTGNPGTEGEWGAVTTWPFAFASAANLPDGRIIAWGGNNRYTFNGGNFTYASIWNPADNSLKDANHPTHSLFCGVPVMMEDGRVFVPGGDKSSPSSVKGTSTFSKATDTWTRIEDMNVGRWYDGAVYLPNGKVFAALGDPGSQYPEIWTPGSGWSYMNGGSLQAGALNYPTVTEPKNWLPHLHLAPNGQILHSGHTPEMHLIDTDGNGAVLPVTIANDWNTANSPSILFDEGKILQAGGSLYDATNTATTKAALLDVNGGVPTRTLLNDMQYPRIFHNQVALPNGEVLVIGGNTTGTKFSDVGSQLTPEIWNPTTKTWRTVASHTIPRNYHSVALLMVDGRVWSGGGGLCGCGADHPNSQVYSPPYLFNADGTPVTNRPQITAIQSSTVSFGQDINISTTPDVTKFSMVKMSATTHALNSDMRYLNVPFKTLSNGNFKLSLHTNRNVMTPGYWMLFALNAQGVPSIAKIIRVSTTNSPVIENVDTQITIINNAVTLNLVASDPNAGDTLTYDAAGLPTGLTINKATGQISGKPLTVGNFLVVASVTDGINEVSTKFLWKIVTPQTPLTSPLYGGSTGNPFTDTVAANQYLTSVNVSGGWWLDSIQGFLNSGTLTKHGGTGGTLKTASWPAGEYLVRMFGVAGPTYVGKISFVTNTGRTFGPYGTATNIGATTNFDFSVPDDSYEIIGFTGRSSTSLHQIGAIYRARQNFNQPPAVTDIPDQINYKGQAVSLAVSATDPEGDAITYSATGLPAGLTISSSTGVISGTPTTQASYNTIITVKDSKGASAAVNLQWAINLVALIIDQPTTSPKLVNTGVSFTANVVNATNPRFKWSFGDGTAETAYSTSPVSPAHTYQSANLNVVRLTVTDDTGAVSTKTFVQAIYQPHTSLSPSASSNILVSKNGAQLWVVNQDNNSVSIFTTSDEVKRGETNVGLAPRAIAQAPDGSFWVTNKQSATISVLSSTTFAVTKTINLPFASQPYGIAFAPNEGAAYVALEAVGKLLKLDPVTGAQLGSVDIGRDPRHLSITADSSKVLVSRYITRPLSGESTAVVQTPYSSGGEVVVVNTSTMAINSTVILRHSDLQDNTIAGSGIPNYLNVAAISPDGSRAWVPSKQDNIKRGSLRNGNNLDFQNTVRGISSKINLVTMAEEPSERIDYDNTGLGTAAIYDKSGNYLFVALEATREIALVDAYNGIVVGRVNVGSGTNGLTGGRAPDGLALSSDGNKLYVNNFMDRTVSIIDLTKVFTVGDWSPPVVSQLSSVGTDKLNATVLKGKQLFYDAKDSRLARDGYLSCAVCHNDGADDGRVWDLTGMGEGLRNTINLRGRSGTGHGLLHWSANFDEVQDFEGQIRSLAAGTGLLTNAQFTATSSTFGSPKAGLNAELDALAAYLESLNSFSPSPLRNADGTLTAAAIAGKAVFTSAGCTQCHGGQAFTDSPAGFSHDIGTIKTVSGQRLNGALTALDTPTLRDVWNTPPYLHDGSAPTLEAAITAHTAVPSVANLTAAQITQVAAYVQQIGGTEPAPSNSPPSVAVTSPANGANFLTTAAINLTANATDSDGTIAKVEFYAGTTLLSTITSAPPYSFVWRGAAAGTYSITARAYDNMGGVTTSMPVSITVQADSRSVGTGLTSQYFNNKGLVGTSVLSRQENVNFSWGIASPGTGVTIDYFSARWSGQFLAPTTGVYQFQTIADDGVRLTIDGTLVIDNWINQALTTKTSPAISLVAGQKYTIKMEYFDNTGTATARLLWKAPGQTTFVAIPVASLFNS